MDTSPLTADGLHRLRLWFRTEARPYPWMQTDDPYAIWISEVMLQQTVVTGVIARFQTWMRRWPDLATLAAADEESVIHAWEGLGYPSRARNLHRAARHLVASGRLTLPDTTEALKALPGIGEYTASAILSFAFHQPTLTLDANLKRVFQRLDAVGVWSTESEVRWRGLWATLVDGQASRESNQAVMQLGQRVCRAKNPLCERCPLAHGCQAYLTGATERIPEVVPKRVHEKTTTVILWYRGLHADQWWLARPQSGRFSSLWMAPPCDATPLPTVDVHRLTARIHSYTKYRDHLTPYMAPWVDPVDPPLPSGWTGRWATVKEAATLGMASVYRKILQEAIGLTIL